MREELLQNRVIPLDLVGDRQVECSLYYYIMIIIILSG